MNIKPWIIVGTAFVSGAAIGFFVGRKSNEAMVDAILAEHEEEIERKQNLAVEDKKDDRPIAATGPVAKDKGDISNLSRLARKYHDKDFTEHIEERQHPMDDIPDEDAETHIQVISEDDYEYWMEVGGYDFAELSYLKLDQILLDDAFEVVINWAEYIGSALADDIDNVTDNILYVLNPMHGNLYELTINDTAHYQDVFHTEIPELPEI